MICRNSLQLARPPLFCVHLWVLQLLQVNIEERGWQGTRTGPKGPYHSRLVAHTHTHTVRWHRLLGVQDDMSSALVQGVIFFRLLLKKAESHRHTEVHSRGTHACGTSC